MLVSRRTLLRSAAALPLAACITSVAGQAGKLLRVATFNIWHDAGDWAARRPLLVQALREADADVIALQEVLQDEANGLPNQAETIAQALGGYSVHFTSTNPPDAPRRYGNAILSRLPVTEEASVRLKPLNDHRTALRVRVALRGHTVDVANTHLAWQPDAGPIRARQIDHLLGWLPRDGVPLILMGDFNAELDDLGLAAIAASRFASALPPGTAPTTLNTAKGHSPRVIDHVFMERRWFAPVGARMIGDRPTDGEYPSDHFGVVAQIRLR